MADQKSHEVVGVTSVVVCIGFHFIRGHQCTVAPEKKNKDNVTKDPHILTTDQSPEKCLC